MKIECLSLSWSVSRGQETAGYNICHLDSRTQRYKTTGGGYDMVGTVLGLWLNDTHQGRLQGLFKTRPSTPCTYAVPGYLQLPDLYGITLNPKGVADCDGGCGISSMKSIAWAIGLDVRPTYSRTGRLDGFIVSWEEA